MQITIKKTAELSGYTHNARSHSPSQIAKIADSIREYGFNNPILIDETDTIIAGHGRLAAAKKLGLEEVPCIVLAHLTESKRRAYILADNRLGDLSVFDQELLEIEIAALSSLDIPLIGFDDLDQIAPDKPKKTALKKVDLAAPELAWVLIGVPLVQYGDIQTTIDALALNSSVTIHTTVTNK